MNNKQSSVTELYNKMMQYVPIEYHELVREEIPLGQYEAMHKEEIENAYSRGWEKSVQYEIQRSEEEDAKRFTPRNYYNETYGGNNGETMDN